MLVAATPGDYRYRFKGKFKTLRSLPSEHRIELGFFLGLQNYRPNHRENEFTTVGPWRFFEKSLIIGHKTAFVLVKSCNSVEEVWFHPCSKTSWIRLEWHIGS